MELSFRTAALRRKCEDLQIAIADLGLRSAESLIEKLAELRAATSLSDVSPEVKPEKLGNVIAFEICVDEHSVIKARSNHIDGSTRSPSRVRSIDIWRIRIDFIGGGESEQI